MSAKILVIACGLVLSLKSTANTLEETILALDKQLFGAFNQRDVQIFQSFLDPELEFYHDKAGLTGFQHTVNSLQDLVKKGSDLTRKLVPQSSEIFPIPEYGAMQWGQHEFCHSVGEEMDCGTFKFLHIWQNQAGKWRITRVVSYDHSAIL